MFEYFDNDFARGRLNDTIIRIGGKAALIREIGGDQDLIYTDLESGDEGVINIRHEDVSIIPPRLGYITLGAGWFYCERFPERRWKQGIPLNIIAEKGPITHKTLKSLGKSLNGKYTKFNVAKRSKGCTAFSLHFAVSNGLLMFKGKPVGDVSVEGVVKLADKFIFLKEYLEESLK